MDRQLHDELRASAAVTYGRPSSVDCAHIARHMRPSDVRELLEHPFNMDRSVLEMAHACVSVSEQAWVACADGEPFVMFGVQRPSQTVAHPWMFGTPLMLRFRKQIVQEAPKWLEALRGEAVLLSNIFDTRNTVHIRWAKSLGFEPSEQVVNHPNYQYMVKRY